MTYDTIIIGGGPAGLTAAIYLGRYQRQTLVITGDIGGQTAIAGTLENFPGFQQINGFELVSKMLEQAQGLEKVEVKTREMAKSISSGNQTFAVQTEKGEYQAKTVLIAAGKRHRELGLSNEKQLIGKGLSYCATCDGPFSKDKDVIVIGGGYAATEAALILNKNARSITLVNIGDHLSGETLTINKIESDDRIKVINGATTTSILEDEGLVGGIEYATKSGEKNRINGNMVFVEIGQIPNTELFQEIVELNENGEIVVDDENQTNSTGIFAAGDVTNIKAKQTIVACGEGAKAAIRINNYLESQA